MAGGVSVTRNCNVSVLYQMPNLKIRNIVFHNSDVEDEAVSEVNMIYASQVTWHACSHLSMHAHMHMCSHTCIHPYSIHIHYYIVHILLLHGQSSINFGCEKQEFGLNMNTRFKVSNLSYM